MDKLVNAVCKENAFKLV